MTSTEARHRLVQSSSGAPPASTPRAAVYLRVSTGRQAEHDLSIPDQKAQTEAWVAQRGWRIVAEYIEPGASATDDKRPQFQRMIERACDGENAFDVIVVHSFSRFFRDAFGLEFYLRKLAKHGVKLVSITQELGDDPAQVMMRQVIALFDEYQSKENAKHVLRAMKENTRQGFWNGSRPPLGYKVVEAERRGARTKKKLAIDPVEAETVRLIFRLCFEGDNGSGPMGIKAITSWLNAHGYRTRTGGLWGLARVHELLTNPVYNGRLRFNRKDSRTYRLKAEAEHVYCDTDPIVSPFLFDDVQRRLKSRNPKVAPPRTVSGPILLPGLATCATCGGGMTLRSGTSRTSEIYRYYSCNRAMKMGKIACKGRSIRMDKLDTLVTEHLADRLLDPERLSAMLTTLAGRRADKQIAVDRRIAVLAREVEDAEERLRRLYRLVEDGLAQVDEILKDRIASLKASQAAAVAALDRAKSATRAIDDVSPLAVDRFARIMRGRLTTGEVTFRKAYISSLVDRIEVDDAEVRIMGRKEVLEQAVRSSVTPPPVVHSFVPSWRAKRDEAANTYVIAIAV
ncbi:MAG: recombinase family protein [Rhodospirillales bacterium]|nr:recombinase family protein [Rhodospirillales bacterium]